MRHALTLAVGPAVFRVGSDLAAPIAALRALYATYPAPDRPADFTVRLTTPRHRRLVRPHVAIDGDYAIAGTAPLPLRHGLLAAEMAMNLQLAFGWRAHALIHASAVARRTDGGAWGAILCPGQSGSGKSTLAALAGEEADRWRLMGDEFTLLTLDGAALLAMPRPVSLKNAAISAVAARVDPRACPDRWGPVMEGTPKGRIRHLVPRADALATMREPAAPVAILFPRFDGGGGPHGLRPLEPAETFVRLTEATANYVALGEAGFRALTRLAATTPAFEGAYADGASGLSLLDAVWSACR